MSSRKDSLERKTRETTIKVEIDVDGKGASAIETGLPLLDHMLSAFAKHGSFNLNLKARGDLEVDEHHTIEDTGIVIGKVLAKALKSKKAIRRFGFAYVPMDETLALVAVDISGRPYLKFNAEFPQKKRETFNPYLFEEFFRGLVSESRITLHINLLYGKSTHHIIEAIFKAFGLALQQATRIVRNQEDIPSTKGML